MQEYDANQDCPYGNDHNWFCSQCMRTVSINDVYEGIAEMARVMSDGDADRAAKVPFKNALKAYYGNLMDDQHDGGDHMDEMRIAESIAQSRRIKL